MTDSLITDSLKKIYKQGNISFFLGAGISVGNGLPTWDELVASMYFRYMEQERWSVIHPYPNYLYAISKWYIKHLGESSDIIVRKLKTGWSEKEFQENVWETLYSSYRSNSVYIDGHENKSLNSIRDFVIDANNNDSRKIKSVITYNFDDLLEQSFVKKNYQNVQTIFSDDAQISTEKLPIYHVHGYIPFNNNQEKNMFGRIVLSEEDYNLVINDHYFWGNLLQQTFLTSTTNFMIGLSLADRNLRRLLEIVSRQPLRLNNYIFLQKSIIPELNQEDIREIHKEAMAIVKKWKSNPYVKTDDREMTEVKQILDGVIKNDIENQERVLEQFKVKPIWCDDHNDIAAYLSAMKN